MSVDNLIDGLTVTATVCKAQNYNFDNAGPDEWAALTLTFTYDTVIKDKVEIKAVFSVTECIKSTYQKNMKEGYSSEDFFEGRLPVFDIALNNYSQTDIDLSVLIRSKDTSEDDYFDITKEIEDMTKPGDEGDAATFLEEILGSKGDDIDLVDQNLVSLMIPIDPIGIFQLNFDLNFVVKVNFAAGISTHTTVMASKQIGVSRNDEDGLEAYENTISGSNRYTFDFYCAGYLGFKAGLKLSIGISALCMPKLGKAGVSGEVGAYIDLYGFMHINISKLFQYSDYKDVSLQGGLYMEVGIYVELKLFAKSEWGKAKASYTLYERSVPAAYYRRSICAFKIYRRKRVRDH